MLLKLKVTPSKGNAGKQIERLAAKLSDAHKLNTAVGKGFERTLRRHFRELDKRPNRRGWKKSHFWQKIAADTAFIGADEQKATVAVQNASGRKFAAKVFGARIRPKSGKKFLAIPAIEARYGVSPSSLDKSELQFRRTRRGGFSALYALTAQCRFITGSCARPTLRATPTRCRRKKPYWRTRKRKFQNTLE